MKRVMLGIVIALSLGLSFGGGQAAGAVHGSGGGRRRSPRHRGPAIAIRVARKAQGNVLLHWYVRRDLRRATIRVNGSRAQVRPLLQRGQHLTYSLDAADGLRFGANTISVQVRPRRGRRQTVTRKVHVLADAPLAAITQHRPAISDRPTLLDGSGSRPSGRGRLRYRWRIVGAPRGAHASLRGARRSKPHLLADTPGRYRLALTVSDMADGGPAAAHASGAGATGACSVAGAAPRPFTGGDREGPLASLPESRVAAGTLSVEPGGAGPASVDTPTSRAAPGCATDVETVAVRPNSKPIGVAFDSRAHYEGQVGVRIGTRFFPLPAAREGALYIVLDAQTLGEITSTIIDEGASAQSEAEIIAAHYGDGGDVLVVGAGLPGCCNSYSGAATAGFTLIQNYRSGGGGTVTENQGQELGEGGKVEEIGQLEGWLQPGIPLDGAGEIYSYVSPERVSFDTDAPGTPAGTNTIEVGGHHWSARLPAGATAGFEVLATSPGLQPLYDTPTAFGTDGTGAAAEEAAMESVLSQAASSPGVTVFVQSIGKPTPSTPTAASIGSLIDSLGGNRWVYLSLDGTGEYAFVGTSEAEARGIQATSAEASSQWSDKAGDANSDGEGELQGLLRRTENSAYAPTLADAIGSAEAGATPNYDLDQVVYQPETAWPDDQTPEQVAATSWIAKKLRFGTEGASEGACYQPAVADFRSGYCDSSIEPLAIARGVEGLAYPKSEGEPPQFDAATFAEVQAELELELGYVADVRAFIKTLREPLGTQNPAVEADKIAGEVIDSIPQPQTSATSGNLSLAGSILYAASEVPEVGEALGPIASVLDIASQLTQEDGQVRHEWGIQTAADEIGGQVQRRLRLMSGSLGSIEDILVSDWGKLSTAATEAEGAWGIDSSGIQKAASTIELGISQWMWTAILPAVYELVEFKLYEFPENEVTIPEEPTEKMYCVDDNAGDTWEPWANAAPASVLYPLASFEAGPARRLVSFGMLAGSYSHRGTPAVSPSLAAKIFGPPGEEGGVGLTAPRLTERAHWQIAEPHMLVQGEEDLKVGRCGLTGYYAG